jgi:hypothetical protein
MESNKLMRVVGSIILGTYAFFNLITLLLMNRMFPTFSPELFGPYSIMASKQVFIAYHVWGIILALITIYAMWKDLKNLFLIGLLLTTIVMFYPYFSTAPSNTPAKGKIQPPVSNPGKGNLPAPDTLRGS